MKTVLIAHGYWGRGGAETSTMQLIESLKSDFRTFIITRGGWNLEELNQVSHTSILPTDIKLVKLPFKKFLAQTVGGAIWHALFLRYCRHIGKHYDICVTASRTMGWGRPAVHFLSDVVWNDELQNRFGQNISKDNSIQQLLHKTGRLIAGKASYELHPNDVFIANSQWTADTSAPYTTRTPMVIYPAVSSDFKHIPWEQRSNSFVSIGRISPEKKIEDTITIIEQVRERGHDVDLTIYGAFDKSEYSEYIQLLCHERPWIKTPGSIYGAKKQELLPSFKYGINTCQREAFGISTAEMMKAGIIPFVPSLGAQGEVIDLNELIFEDDNLAVKKIINVLSSPLLQQTLTNEMKLNSNHFSPLAFKTAVLDFFSNI